MDRLLAKLERGPLGRLATDRIPAAVTAGMTIMFVLVLFKPEVAYLIDFNPRYVLQQPWRVVTFLFTPPGSVIFALFTLAWTYWLLTALEGIWGTFKFNVYYFAGALLTIAGAFITGRGASNLYLHESMFFALATLAPNYEIQLMFLPIPIKLKWIAAFSVLLVAYQLYTADAPGQIAIAIAFGNYFVFFSGHLVALLKGRRLEVRQAARRAEQRPLATKPDERKCAICGARQADGADIRVCSCEKCGGPRDLCLEHARNH